VKVRIALAALAGVAMLATVAVAATATSASASTLPNTVSHITYAPRDCAGWQLSATLTRGYQTSSNNRELVLTLTNTSRTACTLSGSPGLQLLNSKYQPLPTTTVQAPGRTFWSGKTVLLPGRSATAEITFAVSGPFYRGWNSPTPAFYQGGAAYLVVTLPGSYPVYGQPNWQPYGQPNWQPYGQPNWQPSGQHFVLPIPGGPVRIVQNRLYETPLMGHFPVAW
jgi:hypothetical protein